MMRVYHIKPLEWRLVYNRPDDGACWSANTVFSTLDIYEEPGRRPYWKYCVDEYYDEGQEERDTVDECKAAAERWYLDRLMPALVDAAAVPAPPPAGEERDDG